MILPIFVFQISPFDWTIGPTSFEKIDDVFVVSNTIGSSVKDPVQVDIYDYNCTKQMDKDTQALSVEIGDANSSPLKYNLIFDQSNFNDDPLVTQHDDLSSGFIEFCTRVSTWYNHSASMMTFHYTKFNMTFNLMSQEFDLTTGLSQANPNSFQSTVENVVKIKACACNNFICVGETTTTITSNSPFSLCLEPEENEVKIDDFEVLISGLPVGDDDYDYWAVEMGSDKWIGVGNSLVEGPNDENVIMTTLYVPAHFFFNYERIMMSGKCILNFGNGKDFAMAPVFSNYDMTFGLEEIKEFGCFMKLIKKMLGLF